jgi:hypothetical protein
MPKPKGIAVMRISIKPKGKTDAPHDDDAGDDYDGPQENGHGAGMKEAMKLIQGLFGGDKNGG